MLSRQESSSVQQKRGYLAQLRTLRPETDLTDLEWRLLQYLRRHEGRTCTYLEIARYLWSTEARPITTRTLSTLNGHLGYAAPMVNRIHQLISALRQKLEVDPRRPMHLASFRGVGYRWYTNVPNLDDGEDYATRDMEVRRLRAEMERVLGVVEGEFVLTKNPDGTTTITVGAGDDEPPMRASQLMLGDGEDEG